MSGTIKTVMAFFVRAWFPPSSTMQTYSPGWVFIQKLKYNYITTVYKYKTYMNSKNELRDQGVLGDSTVSLTILIIKCSGQV